MTGWLGATAAAMVAAAALASCGDDGDGGSGTRTEATPGPAPQVVVRRYFEAVARGDGAIACALLTAAAREAMKELPEGKRARSCEGAVATLSRSVVALRDMRVRDVRLHGANATARVTSTRPRYDSGVLLRGDASGWRIAYPPAVVTKFDTPPGIRPHEDDERTERG